MSIELELEAADRLRVRVDAPGERAVSDVVDPVGHLGDVASAAGLEWEVVGDRMTIYLKATEHPEGQGSGAAGSVETPDA